MDPFNERKNSPQTGTGYYQPGTSNSERETTAEAAQGGEIPFFAQSAPASPDGKSPRKAGVKPVLLVLAVLCLLAGASCLIETVVTGISEPIDVTDVAASSVAAGNIYYIGDAIIADTYGYAYQGGSATDEDDIDVDSPEVYEDYCLLLFWDRDGALCAASLDVARDEALSEELWDYMYDDSQLVGDFMMPGYYRAEALPDDEQADMLEEMFDQYDEWLGGIERVYVSFEYASEDEAALAQSQRQGLYTGIIASGFLMIAGFVLLVCGLVVKKKPASEPVVSGGSAYGSGVYDDSQNSGERKPWDPSR